MKTFTILFIALSIAAHVRGQEEVDPSKPGKRTNAKVQDQLFTIEEFHNNTRDSVKGKQAIVDINSNLTIHLKKDAITAYLAQKLDQKSSSNAQILVLNQVLEKEIEVLKLLSMKVNTADAGKQLQQLGSYSVLMSQFYNSVLEIPELRAEVNRLVGEYYQKANLNEELYPNAESYLVRNLSVFNKNMLKELQSGSLSKVQVMLRAYMQSKNGERRKVHIVNFDNYALGEYYEIPRWVTSFSAEDQAAYQQASNLASIGNAIIAGNVTSIKEVLASQLESANAVKTLGDSIMMVEQNKEAIFANALAPATAYLKELNGGVAQLYQQLNELQNLPGGADAQVLEHYNQSINSFIRFYETFNTNTQQLATQLPDALKNNNHLKNLQTEVDKCITAVKKDIEKVKTIKQLITGMLQPFATGNQAVKEVAGETFKKAIVELPDQGYLDLKTVGKRLNGEIIDIALSYEVKTDSNKVAEEIQFDQTQLTMQLVDFYSVSSISVVLAHPFNKSDAVILDRNYQFAPAASLLLKFGSRKWNAWNSLSPGAGLILATPDMDLDGSPDFSFGAVTSFFRDVLSFGVSYNTRTDSPFTHIGLSLPFNVFGGIQYSTAPK